MHTTWCLVVGLLTFVRVVFTNNCDMERVTLDGMDTSHNGVKETLHTVVATLHNTCISTGCKEACCSNELCNTAVFSEGHNGGPCTCLLLQCNPIASCKSIIGTQTTNEIWVRYVTNKGANSTRKKRKTSKGDKHKRDEKGLTGSPGNATNDTAKKDKTTNQTKTNATTTNNKVDKQATEVTSSKSGNKVTTQSTPTTHGGVTTGTTQKATSTDQKNMTKQEQILQSAIDKSANTVNNTKLSEGHNATNEKTIVLPTPSPHLNSEATTATGNVTAGLKNTSSASTSTKSGHTSSQSIHSTTAASTNTTTTKQVSSESSTKRHPSSTPAAQVTGQARNATSNMTTTAKPTTKVVDTTPSKDAKTKKPVTTASPITNGSHPATSTTPAPPSRMNNTVPTMKTTTTPKAPGHSQKSGNASSSSNNTTKKETSSSKPEVTTATTAGTKTTTHKVNTSPSHNQTQTTSSSSDQKNHTTPSNHKGKAGKAPTSSTPAGSLSTQNTSAKHVSNRNASIAAEAVKKEEHDAAVLLKDILEGIPESNHSHPVNGSSAKSRFSSTPKHMTVVLIAFLCIGTLVVIAVAAILGKLVLEGWKRRHYSRVDFLVNGMYH